MLAQLRGAHKALVAVRALDLLSHGVFQAVAVQLVWVFEGFGTHLWDMHSYLLKTSVNMSHYRWDI